jgi:hypothetical protein
MLQRGRKSASSFVLPAVDGRPERLEPPATLSEDERNIFEQLVASVDRRHFRPSDLPLVVAYVQAIFFEREAARQMKANPAEGKHVTAWEKSTKVLVALSARLRLCPQSRQHPRSAARAPAYSGPRPWQER